MDRATLRRQLRDDLRREFRGELLIDPVARTLYSTDASLFQVDPLAVAVPLDEDDLRLLVRYAHERSLPIVPRGAGTGIAGEALGPGLVLDLSIHFRSIRETGDDWVRVQPGVVLNRLNAELAKSGRRFAPDPSSGASCTVGGMIATNASGDRAAIHGYTRDHLRNLRVVWDDGTVDEVTAEGTSAVPRTADIRNGVTALFEANADIIGASRPRTPFNRCGYRLYDVAGPAGVDLVRLLAGSEGTLALIAEATLKTIPLPGGRAAMVAGFTTFEAALYAGLSAREHKPAACEVLDHRLVSMARSQSLDAAARIPLEVEAVLLIEFEGETPAVARESARALVERMADAITIITAFDDREIENLWAIRAAALPSLYALGKGPRPLAFVEDIGIPPDDLPQFVAQAKGLLKQFETSASFLVHVATGQVHLRPILDPDDPTDAAKLWPLADQLHSLAIELGGTVSAQNGTGLARTPWVERQYPTMMPVLVNV